MIATLADRAAAEGATVRIATSDKDLMQLVDGRVRIVPPTKTDQELDAAGVEAKTGVRPSQIVDWLALIGDAADNIPGVKGIGPKTATKLIARFGSLADCFEQAGEDRVGKRAREIAVGPGHRGAECGADDAGSQGARRARMAGHSGSGAGSGETEGLF